METLSEFLKNEENQTLVLARIVSHLRDRGESGRRGLFAKIGKAAGLSPAYVGQVFSRKRPLTDTFVEKVALYLGVRAEELRRGKTGNNVEILEAITHEASRFSGMADQVLGAGGLERALGGKASLEEFRENCKNILSDSDLTTDEAVAQIQALLEPIILSMGKAIKDAISEE